MSDPLTTLLQEEDRNAHEADSAAAEAMYDELFETMRADGQLASVEPEPSHDVNTSPGPSGHISASLNSFEPSHPSPETRQPSIPIPAGLAGIASHIKPLDLSFDDPALNLTYEVIQDDRGEMGGKRKKPLHERAGWKDMDERGQMPKRPRVIRGPKKGANANPSAEFQAEEGREGDVGQGESSQQAHELADGQGARASTLDRDMAQAGREMGLEQTVLADVLRQAEDQTAAVVAGAEEAQPGGGPADEKGLKTSKAEQNRRAQQVYRRRREEKIKDLEAQAAALEPTRQALRESYERMKSLAMEYEAAKIQLSALQNTLLSLNKQGIAILTTQFNFPMDPDNLKEAETMRPGPIAEKDVERAFEQLERQSRELAESRRSE